MRYSTPFCGTTTDSTLAGKAYGGLAALNGKIYAVSTDGIMVSIDLLTMSVDPVAGADSARNTSDLASCYYPTLAPQIDADKTFRIFSKGTGNTSANPQPGDTLEYRIVVRNSGSLNSVNTKFYDAIPTGTTYVAGSTQMNFATVADSGGNMPFTVSGGRLINSPGETTGTVNVDTTDSTVTTSSTDADDNEVVITFRVTIQAGVANISNQGNVTYLDGPSSGVVTDNPGTEAPNDPTKTTVLIADISVTKTGPAYANPDGTITYTIKVTNNGPSTAQNISTVDTLPSAVTLVSSNPAGTSATDASGNKTLTWTLASLASGASQTYTVTTNAPSAATLQTTADSRSFTNSVTTSSPSDSSPANNTATASTQMVYTTLVKKVRNVTRGETTYGTSGTGLPGHVLEYCIDATNYGGVDLQNYVISDGVPPTTTPNVTSGVVTYTTPVTVNYNAATTWDADGTGPKPAFTVSGIFSTSSFILTQGSTATLCFRSTIR